MNITGTFCAVESPDHIAVEVAGLREVYLLALMKRDAKIWNAHYHKSDLVTAANDSVEAFGAHVGGRTDAHYIEKRAPTVVASPRLTKKEQAAVKRAKDEKRIAEFVAKRHPLVAAATPERVATLQRAANFGSQQKITAPSPRLIAKAKGDPTYFRETPCATCGNRIFRTSNWKCTVCEKRWRREARQKAKTNNVKSRNVVARELEKV